MDLEVGTTLGVYEVLSAIVAGGMGEVYKDRDTKLDRDVALKIKARAEFAGALIRLKASSAPQKTYYSRGPQQLEEPVLWCP